MDLINIRTSKNICIDINLIAFNSLFFWKMQQLVLETLHLATDC